MPIVVFHFGIKSNSGLIIRNLEYSHSTIHYLSLSFNHNPFYHHSLCGSYKLLCKQCVLSMGRGIFDPNSSKIFAPITLKLKLKKHVRGATPHDKYGKARIKGVGGANTQFAPHRFIFCFVHLGSPAGLYILLMFIHDAWLNSNTRRYEILPRVQS